jgi:hypothetical protein
VLPADAKQRLEVYAAFKIPKTGLLLPICDTMHCCALEKRQCATVQEGKASMKPAVLSFLHSRAKANSPCNILIAPILILNSGMTPFYFLL